MFFEKSIIYFQKPGKQNTEKTLKAAKKRAEELDIRDIVIASSHGETAIKLHETFDDPKFNLVTVTICEGFKEKGWSITAQQREELIKRGIKVLTSSHALGANVGAAFTDKYGVVDLVRVIRDTLYRFGQGMKVSVEIILMSADAGLIPMNKDIMAIAGTGDGADTCIIVKPAYPQTFFDLEIREIVTMPRSLS
jgi:hypothetical protein